MVADWHDGFVLRSEWSPGEAQSGTYRLILTNKTAAAITGFGLGISGPARINEQAVLANGRVVTQLSNYAELAPAAGFRAGAGGGLDGRDQQARLSAAALDGRGNDGLCDPQRRQGRAGGDVPDRTGR